MILRVRKSRSLLGSTLGLWELWPTKQESLHRVRSAICYEGVPRGLHVACKSLMSLLHCFSTIDHGRSNDRISPLEFTASASPHS